MTTPDETPDPLDGPPTWRDAVALVVIVGGGLLALWICCGGGR